MQPAATLRDICVAEADTNAARRPDPLPLLGRQDVLNVECDKCGRRGPYHVHRLIERYGIDAKLFEWSDEVTVDCRRKRARNLNDQCGGAVS